MRNVSESDQLISRPPAVVAIESSLSVLFLVSAAVGNLLVFFAVFRNPRLRKSSSVYIVCLAVTDFSMGVLVFPIIAISTITGAFPGGTALCWFQALASFYFTMVSVLTMAMIAVQRYFKVVKPNKHREIFTFRFFVWSIAFIWSMAASELTIIAVTGNGVHFYEGFPICIMSMNYIVRVFIVDILGLISPFLLMSFSYFRIWRFIKNHNSQMNQSNVNAEELKLTKSLFVVVGAFTACYAPFSLATILIMTYGLHIPQPIQFYTQCAFALASVVNPIVYGAMNRDFRQEFSRIICRIWTRDSVSVGPVIPIWVPRRYTAQAL